MEEPIIVMPLSQYEKWKESHQHAEEAAAHICGTVMSAAIPALLKARETMCYTQESVREDAKALAMEVIKRLSLDE